MMLPKQLLLSVGSAILCFAVVDGFTALPHSRPHHVLANVPEVYPRPSIAFPKDHRRLGRLSQTSLDFSSKASQIETMSSKTASNVVDGADAKQLSRRESLDSSSDDSEPRTGSVPVSRVNSADKLSTPPAVPVKKVESLQERGRAPPSFYVTVACIVMLEACSDMYNMETVQRWWSSVVDRKSVV